MSQAPSRPPSIFTDPKKLFNLVRDAQKKVIDARNQAAATASVAVSQKKPAAKPESLLDSFGKWIDDTSKSVGKAITVGLDDIENFGTSLFKDFSSFLNEQVGELDRTITGLANGIGIDIEGVGIALLDKIEGAKNFVDNTLSDISSNIGALPELVKQGATQTVDFISDRLTTLGAEFSNVVSDGIASSQKFIGDKITSALAQTRETLEDVSGSFNKTIERVQKNAGEALDTISDSFNDAALYTLNGFSSLTSTIEKLFAFDAKSFLDISEEIATEQVKRALARTITK